ncbi:hypothetical protein R2F61_05670 [Mollicutes bacterium LVI A0078]|nr:hypothetical protein RZE84_05675 [Mollicutes bacterium LVI A0075]WOO90218.1 hypothetical protein R2F61_05670 [Mollicutes bacterium LVI A0078]
MRVLFKEGQTTTEKYIAKCIIDLGEDFDAMTIESFSNYIGVSPSMVVKFSKNCGFSGYKEIKYYVKNNRSAVESIGSDYVQFQSEKISNFFSYIGTNQHLIDDLADKIIASKYIVIYGHGPSLGVGKYFANRLSVAASRPVIVQDDEQIMDIEIEKANSERLVILLSASLNTDLILGRLEQMCRTKDNYVVLYENENYDIEFENGIKLLDKNIEYDYRVFRDRSLYFIYLELVFNNICEKLHNL